MLRNTAIVVTLVLSFFLLINGLQSIPSMAENFSNQIDNRIEQID